MIETHEFWDKINSIEADYNILKSVVYHEGDLLISNGKNELFLEELLDSLWVRGR